MERPRYERRFMSAMVCACAVVALCVPACSRPGLRRAVEVQLTPKTSYTDETTRRAIAEGAARLDASARDYKVGPEDELEISVFEWEQPGKTRTVVTRVAQSGVVALPVLGTLHVAGLTVEEITDLLVRRLRDDGILRDPRVTVRVTDFRSKRVAVLGAVEEPGVYGLRRNATTLLGALALAGGLDERAGQVAYIIRSPAIVPPSRGAEGIGSAAEQVIPVDLHELLEEGRAAADLVLENGDVVHVPEAKQFFVLGFVQEPGGYPLSRPTTLLEGIALAGGLREREASPGACVLRRKSDEGEQLFAVDLDAIARGKSPDIYLRPNDVIEVRQTFARKVAVGVIDFFKGMFHFGVGYTLNQ